MDDSDEMSERLDLVNLTDISTQNKMGNTSTDGFITLSATTNRVSTKSYPKNITLDIGGRKFKTSLDTLRAESGLFRQQLSERFTWTPEDEGSYFLDTDPDLFAHLLAFMRRPQIFPLFYDAAKGFNYDLYNKLEVEAEYFQVDALHKWIKDKKYTQAIKTQITSATLENVKSVMQLQAEVSKGGEIHITPCTRKVYLCPRQITAHRGHAEQCGGACHRRQAENDVVYENEPYWQVLSFKRNTMVDEKVCRIK